MPVPVSGVRPGPAVQENGKVRPSPACTAISASVFITRRPHHTIKAPEAICGNNWGSPICPVTGTPKEIILGATLNYMEIMHGHQRVGNSMYIVAQYKTQRLLIK